MLLRCPRDAEDLNPAEEDCQRHRRGTRGAGGDGAVSEGSSAMPCAACPGGEVCWVPAWDWKGRTRCVRALPFVPTCQTPAGRTSNDPCKLRTVKLLQVGALALCRPWQQGEKGPQQRSGSGGLCRGLLAVPLG